MDFTVCCSTWPNALNSLTHHSFGHNLVSKPLEVWEKPASSEPWLRRAAQLRARRGRCFLINSRSPKSRDLHSALPVLHYSSRHSPWHLSTLSDHLHPWRPTHIRCSQHMDLYLRDGEDPQWDPSHLHSPGASGLSCPPLTKYCSSCVLPCSSTHAFDPSLLVSQATNPDEHSLNLLYIQSRRLKVVFSAGF